MGGQTKHPAIMGALIKHPAPMRGLIQHPALIREGNTKHLMALMGCQQNTP
jgi:hypothetical protein